MQVTSNSAHQGEAPDIELASLVEQWLFYVLLNDVGPTVSIYVGVLHQRLYVVDVPADLDATASVGVLTWLHDPEGLSELGQLVEHGGLIGVGCIVIELLKLQKLGVVKAFLDVESQRKEVMVLFANCFVVDLHVVKDGFLVAQMVVVLHFAVQQQVVRSVVFLLLFILVVPLLGCPAEDPAVFGSTAVGSCRIRFLELDFRAGVPERG